MKMRYLAIAVAGILAVGSFTVMAKEVGNAYQVSVAPKEVTGDLTYEEIQEILNDKSKFDSLSDEQLDQLLDYCRENMRGINGSSNRVGKEHECH